MSVQDDKQVIQNLVQKVAPNGKLLGTWPLEGGKSAQMTGFEIEGVNGQRQKFILRRLGEEAVRRNPYAAQDEYRLLEMVRSLGLAVPAPVYLGKSQEQLPAPYLVIEYIEGEIDFSPADTENTLFQMARTLAQIHNIDCSRLDLSFLEEASEEYSQTLRKRPDILDESLEEGRIREVLEAVWPIPLRNTPMLLHGDYWPGNLIWQEDELKAVIDWEDAQCGDPLTDLAISRLDILWIFGMDAMMIFTEHYQSMTTFNFADLPYWDLCAALRFIRLAGPQIAKWAAFFEAFGRFDISEQSIREHVHYFIRQAFEKLE